MLFKKCTMSNAVPEAIEDGLSCSRALPDPKRHLSATIGLTLGSVASAIYAVYARDGLDQSVFGFTSAVGAVFAGLYGRRAWQLSDRSK